MPRATTRTRFVLATAAFLAFAASLAAPLAPAAVVPPSLLNYQGVLRNASGTPAEGAYDFLFFFYDASTGGNMILSDRHQLAGTGSVIVSKGVFNATLGGGAVSDGSGPGVYTSLDMVFNDYSAVWMEIVVGPAGGFRETLAPRVRLLSSAYALSAGKVGGLSSGNYINTTATGQTKTGPLTLQSGLTGNSSAFGVYGVGAGSGGVFANGDLTSIALIGHSAFGQYGIHASGTDAGGFFRDSDNAGTASLGIADDGVEASGLVGATIFNQVTSGTADLAQYDVGVEARGNFAGGFVINTTTGYSWASVATQYGIEATGRYLSGLTGSGGHFQNTPYTGQAWTAIGDTGLYATGSYGGGEFLNTMPLRYGHSSFASGDFGVVGQGRYNSLESQGGGGYFADPTYGGRATLGSGQYGVWASGPSAGGNFFNKNGLIDDEAWAASGGDGVRGWTDAPHVSGNFYWHDVNNGSTPLNAGIAFNAVSSLYTISGNGLKAFAQNDPTDPSRQVIFVALEGDEAGTYTRGTGRIHRGEARLALDPAFTAATNPDIGLTALVTPRGAAIPVAVTSLTADTLVVGTDARGAEGTIVDYAVYGLRLGFEAHSTLEPKREDAPIPPDPVEPPDASSPWARFASMRGAGGVTALPDMTRSAALKAAVRSTSTPAVSMREAPAGQARAARPTASVAPIATTRASANPRPTPLPAAGAVLAFDTAAGTLVPATGATGEVAAGIAAVLGAATSENGLALGGSIVWCDVDAAPGAIQVGDLLAPSTLAGHARRAAAGDEGAIVAKALEPLAEGTGTIRVLVLSR